MTYHDPFFLNNKWTINSLVFRKTSMAKVAVILETSFY